MLGETGDKLTPSDRQAIEGAVERLKKAIESNDQSAMERASNELTAAQHKAAESLYKNAAGPQSAEGQAEAGPAAAARRAAR